MGRLEKVLSRVLRGTSDRNIEFRDLRWLLRKLDFDERIRGDHHIFAHSQIDEIINLQPKGSKAKPYQVRQVREILTRYGLAGEDDVDDESANEPSNSDSAEGENDEHNDSSI